MSESTYKITGTFAGAEQIISKYKQIEQAVKSVENANKALAQSSAGGLRTTSTGASRRKRELEEEERGLMKLARQYDRYHQLQRETRGILRDQFEPLRVFGQEAKSLLRAEAQFKALNLGARDTALGLAAVDKTARQVGGIRLDNLTTDLIGLKSVFGDLRNAIEFLPTAAKTRFTFQSLFNADPRELEADILHTMKALEQMGAIRQLSGGGVDKARFQQFFDTVVRIKSYTGGRIGGRELKNFVATSGVSGMALEPEGLFNMMSLMEAMGGDRTGTALMSAFTSFRALRQGAGGQRAGHALAQLGLLDLNSPSIEWSKEGRIKRMSPGALPIADLLGKDPLQFADAMAEAIKKNGQSLLPKRMGQLDMSSGDHIATILTQLTGNKNSAQILAKMSLMRENIRKDAEAAKKSMGLEDMNKLAEESPLGKILKMEAAIDNFKQKAGISLLEVLAELGTAAMPFVNFLGQHPKLALMGILGTKAAISFFQIANALRHFRMAGKVLEATEQQLDTLATTASSKGSRIGSALVSGIKISIAAFAVENLISDLFDRAARAAEEKKATFEVGDLQKRREKLQEKIKAKPFSKETVGLREQLAEIDKQIGETYITKLSATEMGGYFSMGSEFAERLSILTKGRFGAMLSGEVGTFAPSRSAMGFIDLFKGRYGGEKEKLLTDMPKFESITQVQAFIDGMRKSGKWDEEHIGMLKQLIGEKYPNLIADMTKLSGKVTDAASAVELFKSKLDLDFLPSSKGEGGGDTKSSGRTFKFKLDLGKGIEGEHSAGGLTRKDNFAKVHRNEVITPLDQVGDILRRAGVGQASQASTVNVTNHVTVNVTGSGNTQDVERAAYAGVIKAEREMERTLNRMIRDRALTGHTNI